MVPVHVRQEQIGDVIRLDAERRDHVRLQRHRACGRWSGVWHLSERQLWQERRSTLKAIAQQLQPLRTHAIEQRRGH